MTSMSAYLIVRFAMKVLCLMYPKYVQFGASHVMFIKKACTLLQKQQCQDAGDIQ